MHLGPLPRRILARILSPHAESRRSAQVQRGTASSAPQRSGDSAAPRCLAATGPLFNCKVNNTSYDCYIRRAGAYSTIPTHIRRRNGEQSARAGALISLGIVFTMLSLHAASESECIHARIEHEIISMKSLDCACSLGSLVCISLVNSMPVHAAVSALCSHL
jgi:hypothetical protein